MSPGNLYYHFRNKEEIIRMIFEKIIEYFNDLWTNEEKFSLFEVFNMVFKKNLKVQLKYKFFYLEISTLLNNDNSLKERFREIQKFRIKSMENLIEVLIDNKLLKPEAFEGSYNNIIELIWFISNFGLLQVDLLSEKLDLELIEKKTYFIIELLYPHLTDTGLKEYNKFKKQFLEKEKS